MRPSPLQEKINQILEFRQLGKLVEAESLCRDVLAESPQPGIYHLLGLLNYALGRVDTALEYTQRAIDLNPGDPEARSNLAAMLLTAGRADESVDACRAAIRLQPIHPHAYNNLGNALRQLGRVDEAVSAFEQALAQQPALAEACNNLGNISREKGALDQAIAWYRRALAARADYTEAQFGVAVTLAQATRPGEAIVAYQQLISFHPDHVQAHNNLGTLFQQQGKLNDALACYERAIRLNPKFAPAHNNAGTVLRLLGRLPDAIDRFQTAWNLDPAYSDAANYLGTALREAGRIDEAIAVHTQSISRWPENAQAHFNLSIALLLQGDFSRGLEHYEWRQRLPGAAPVRQNIPCPQWRGEPLSNRRILIHSEQGLGDFLQFVRYVPEIARLGGRVVLDCYPELSRLLAPIPGVEQLTCPGQPLPPLDLHCPVCSLPLAFNTTLQTIPAVVPYLISDPALSSKWRERLQSLGSGLNVALVWAGRPSHHNDPSRSIALSRLSPLAKIPGIRWFSLQKGPAAAQAATAAPGFETIDWTAELNDFADTAAMLANLDLLITVDTAPAHLAGALGKPVWTLLPYAPDFRWLLDRDDSPWYPTMRLFRQPVPGDWESVIAAVKKQLQQLVSERG
jgi:tetratricopeptide (TPR) repeat protein